jgi:hypothetical protein
MMGNYESAYGHNLILLSLGLSLLYTGRAGSRILPWVYLVFLTLTVGLACVVKHVTPIYPQIFSVLLFYGILGPTGYFATKYWREKLLEDEIKRQAIETQQRRKKALLNLEPKLQAIGLTVKERELCLAATYFEGGQKHFSEELGINNGTMSAHLNHIYEKVGKYNFEDLRIWLQAQAQLPDEPQLKIV